MNPAPHIVELRTAVRRGGMIVAAAVLAAGLLTGCAPELDESAAVGLQSRAGEVRTLTAQKNYRAALTALDRLEADLTAAAAAGDVTSDREQVIREAVKLVRADLTAAAAAATPRPTPTPTPTPPPLPVEDDEDEEGDEKGRDEEKGKGKGPGRGKKDD